MLNQLPEISAPHPPHILKTFFPLLDRYGDLTDDFHFRALATDVCNWVNHNPVSWEPYHALVEEVMNQAKSRDLLGIFIAISEGKARQDLASIMCCKSMESVSFVSAIEAAGLRPIYIHLFRDGRDVALSFTKAVVGPKHIYALAQKWRKDQQEALAARGFIPADRFVSLRYEDLIADPEKTLRDLCQALAVEFRDEMLHYFEAGESKRTAHAGRMWENLERPVMVSNQKKFLKAFTPEQLIIFESVAGDVLKELGYSLVSDPTQLRKEFSPDEIQFFEQENKRLIHEALTSADPEDLRKRKPQENLLKSILNRKNG